MFRTAFSDALCDDKAIEAIVVETVAGRGAITGSVFVDASGNGDVAVRAGGEYEQAAKSGEHMMGMTLMYRVTGLPEPGPEERRLWVNGITTRWGPAVGERDGVDPADLTAAEIRARKAVKEHVARLTEEFPAARLIETAPAIGVRETRRIRGHYTITEEDVRTGRPQVDSIAVSSNPVPNYYGERYFLEHLGFAIPYRSLVPVGVQNLLLSGRCISACQPAFQSARSMAPNMAISQASGTAAALCFKSGCAPADLDVRTLQSRLIQEGAVVKVADDE